MNTQTQKKSAPSGHPDWKVAKNDIFVRIADGVEAVISRSEEYQAWYAEYQALEKKLFAISRDLGEELTDVTWRGTTLQYEQAFRLGWELRGDPSRIFELPDIN